MKLPASHHFLAPVLLACALVFGVAASFSLYLLQPSFTESTYALEGQEPESFTMPLYRETEQTTIRIHMFMELGALYAKGYSFTPDDCLKELSVNGQNVELPDPLCLDQHGVPVNLDTYLHSGRNELSLVIEDHGGYGGMSIAPSLSDPLVSAHLHVLALALLLFVIAILLLAEVPSHAMILSLILMGGLFIRLYLSPAVGYSFDVGTNQGWAKSAALLGLSASYTTQLDGNMMPNYPPTGLIIFSGVGHLYQSIYSPDFDRFDPVFRSFIKLPAIFTDLLTALVLFFICGYKDRKKGFLAAAVYTFHPAVIYNSAVWGQVDSIYTLFIVAAFLAVIHKWWEVFGFMAALALLTKMQAVILIPVAALLSVQSSRVFMRSLIGAIVAIIIVLSPFLTNDGLWNIIDVYTGSVGFYSDLSYGAYNFWQAFFGGDSGRPDTDLIFSLFSYRHFGLFLFFATSLIPLSLRWKHIRVPNVKFPNIFVPMLCTALVAYSFFLFNTEMHERYLFPFVALGIPFLFLSRSIAITYICATLLFLLNLLGQLQYSFIDTGLFDTFTNLRPTIGALHVSCFIILLVGFLQETRIANPKHEIRNPK